jgi:histidine ammonia-lyase
MDDMTSAATTPGSTPRPGLPATYSGADTAGTAVADPDPDARPGLEPVTVGTGPLTIDEVVRVARDGAPVTVTEESLAEVRRTREVIRGLADDTEPHYGVSTGFGALATRHIPVEKRHQLQRSLVRSHAAGSGPEVER